MLSLCDVCTMSKKVREKSRECHNRKPQPFPDIKRNNFKKWNLLVLKHTMQISKVKLYVIYNQPIKFAVNIKENKNSFRRSIGYQSSIKFRIIESTLVHARSLNSLFIFLSYCC